MHHSEVCSFIFRTLASTILQLIYLFKSMGAKRHSRYTVMATIFMNVNVILKCYSLKTKEMIEFQPTVTTKRNIYPRAALLLGNSMAAQL